MPEGPRYVILGRGRWAQRVKNILAGEHRVAAQIEDTRQRAGERDADYRERLAEGMRSSDAQIAWACVLPGPHIPLMAEAALDASLHMICEKPWPSSGPITESLAARARDLRRLVAVHYEYCFLAEVERWRRNFSAEARLEFGGRFFLSRPNHTGMAAMDNVGSHLVAIRNYAVPHATIKEIRCGYEQPDERSVWLERDGEKLAFIDLLEQKEQIIQKFIADFEAARDATEFAVDLRFGLRVAEEIARLR
jgi:hypothetical protein